MAVTARHLRSVPDPEPEHPVLRTLAWVHMWNRTIRHREGLERTQQKARREGRHVYVGHLQTAIEALHLAELHVRDTGGEG